MHDVPPVFVRRVEGGCGIVAQIRVQCAPRVCEIPKYAFWLPVECSPMCGRDQCSITTKSETDRSLGAPMCWG